MDRDLGALGESEFKRFCASVGIVANKSDEDKTGWDYFIEFPRSNSESNLDKTPSPLECKIQVKATDGHTQRRSIGLLNFERLVKSSLPSFIVFMEFNNTDRVAKLYLVHIGEKWIRKVLKRLRQLNLSSNTEIRKKLISVKFDKSHELTDLTGSGLKSAIEHHVPDGMEKYAAWKNDLIANLGYEKGFGIVNVQFERTDYPEELVNQSLGLSAGQVTFERIEIWDQRFEILGKEPDQIIEGGHISIGTSKGVLARLECIGSKNRKKVWFDVEIIGSDANKLLQKSKRKLRIKARFFDLIVRPYSNEIVFTYDLSAEQSLPLKDLHEFAELRKMMQDGDVQLNLHSDVSIKLILHSNELSNQSKELIKTIQMLWKLARLCECEYELEVKLKHLITCRKAIETLFNLLIDDLKVMKINMTLMDASSRVDGTFELVSFIYLNLKSAGIGIYCSFFGKPTREGNLFSFIPEKYKIHNSEVLRDKIEQESVIEAIEVIESEERDEEINLIIFEEKSTMVFQ